MEGLMQNNETSFRLPENKFEVLKSKIMRDSVMEPGFIDGLMNFNQPRQYANLANTIGGFLREMVVDPTRNFIESGAKGVRGEDLTVQDFFHVLGGGMDWGVGSSLGAGLMSKGGSPNIASMFVGPSSTDIAKAKTMVAKGIPREQIQKELLMHKKPDGFWRKEISDEGLKINREAINNYATDPKLIGEPDDYVKNIQNDGYGYLPSGKAGKVIEHEELYKKYPELRDIDVYFPEQMSSLGVYGDNKMDLSSRYDRKLPAHELQHAIQEKEGWARGGSPGEFMTKLRTEKNYYETMIGKKNQQMREALEIGDKDRYHTLIDERETLVKEFQSKGLNDSITAREQAHNEYQNLLGEREARDTASRMNLTLDERRGLMPDIGTGSTVKMGGGGPSMEIPAWHGSPHRIDPKVGFMDEAIGTGEGAQAFGYGHYFTDSEAIARNYAKPNNNMLQNKYGDELMQEVSVLLKKISRADKTSPDYKSKIDRAKSRAIDAIEKKMEDINGNYGVSPKIPKKPTDRNNYYKEIIENIKSDAIMPDKHLYKTTLHKGKDPSEYNYLDWDKGVDDKTIGKVLNQAEKEGIDVGLGKPAGHFSAWLRKEYPSIAEDFNKGDITDFHRQMMMDDYTESTGRVPAIKKNTFKNKGQSAYKLLTSRLGSEEEVSKFLKRAGIDGIKYPAGTLSGGNKSNAYNYVVFDPKDITIDEHYVNGLMQ